MKKTINFAKLDLSKPAKFMLHVADSKNSYNQVVYWFEELKKTGVDFSILIRDSKSYDKLIKKYPNEQILYAKTPVDVETIINLQKKLKVVLYVTNMAKNIHILRFNNLQHIYIGSKYSDYLSKINKSFRAYDEIWVSSQYVIDRFKEELAELRHLKFKIIGKPQLKSIFLNNTKKTQSMAFIIKQDIISLKNFIEKCLVEVKELKKYKIYINDYQLVNNMNKYKNIFLLRKKDYEKISFFVVDKTLKNIPLLAYGVPIITYGQKFENIKYQFSQFFINCKELNEIIQNLKSLEVEEYFLGKKETLSDQFIREINELFKN